TPRRRCRTGPCRHYRRCVAGVNQFGARHWQAPPHPPYARREQEHLMADYDYDLFTIGAGSGGVRASRVAAAHGARVAVAEEYRVGGTCVIRGCVPKKMLVYGSQFAEDIHDAAAFDWNVLRDNVLKDVDRLNGLYTQTLENNSVEIIPQRATVSGPHEVTLADGTRKTARYILICTGARPHVPDCPGH